MTGRRETRWKDRTDLLREQGEWVSPGSQSPHRFLGFLVQMKVLSTGAETKQQHEVSDLINDQIIFKQQVDWISPLKPGRHFSHVQCFSSPMSVKARLNIFLKYHRVGFLGCSSVSRLSGLLRL